jgi:hypothetical protein
MLNTPIIKISEVPQNVCMYLPNCTASYNMRTIVFIDNGIKAQTSHILNSEHKYGKLERVMEVLKITQNRHLTDTGEQYYIYKYEY